GARSVGAAPPRRPVRAPTPGADRGRLRMHAPAAQFHRPDHRQDRRELCPGRGGDAFRRVAGCRVSLGGVGKSGNDRLAACGLAPWSAKPQAIRVAYLSVPSVPGFDSRSSVMLMSSAPVPVWNQTSVPALRCWSAAFSPPETGFLSVSKIFVVSET